ncbi:MAG: hypothetical protein WAT19_05125 [Ferruginibacter sp.]
MSIISILTEIAEAMNEPAKKANPTGGQPLRPVPIQAVKDLLKQGRKEQAVVLLQQSMKWDQHRAVKFIDDLLSSEAAAKIPARSHIHSTQIDRIVREHMEHENGAGGSLWDYLFGRFLKKG